MLSTQPAATSFPKGTSSNVGGEFWVLKRHFPNSGQYEFEIVGEREDPESLAIRRQRWNEVAGSIVYLGGGMGTVVEIVRAAERLDAEDFLKLRTALDRVEEKLWARELGRVGAKHRKAKLT